MTHVSVIIPSYNHYDTLKITLQELEQQNYREFEVIVVDDGSTDETASLQRIQFKFPFKYIYQSNSGRSAARNKGIAQAEGEIIVFVDDHIYLDQNFIKEHFDAHQRYYAKGVEVIRGAVGYVDTRESIFDIEFPNNIKAENNPFVTFITNNISIRKRALLLVGGFDEDFKEYGFQDSELGYRLRKLGVKIKYHAQAKGYIFSVHNTIEQRLERFRQAGRSAVIFTKKHKIGALLLGAHQLNIILYNVLSYKNILPTYYEKRINGDNKYFFKRRSLCFLEGIKQGRELYKDKQMVSKRADNVVFILLHQLDLSGAPISSILLANNLQDYLPVIISPSIGDAANRINSEVLVKKLPLIFKKYFLRKLVRKFQPKIIHANTFLTKYALDINGVKKVAHIREDLSKYPKIATEIYNKCDKLIIISKSMIEYFPKDQENKLNIIYNAVTDIKPFSDYQEDNYILYIGSIEERKGLLYLAESVRNIDIKIKVFGQVLDQSYYKRVQKVAGDKLEFMDTTKNLSEYYQKAKVVVMPSLSEPFGRVVLEAISFGKVVIGSDVGGIPEIIKDGYTGFLVPPANSSYLAAKISMILSMTDEEKLIIKKAAYQRALDFSVEKHVENIEKIYRELS